MQRLKGHGKYIVTLHLRRQSRAPAGALRALGVSTVESRDELGGEGTRKDEARARRSAARCGQGDENLNEQPAVIALEEQDGSSTCEGGEHDEVGISQSQSRTAWKRNATYAPAAGGGDRDRAVPERDEQRQRQGRSEQHEADGTDFGERLQVEVVCVERTALELRIAVARPVVGEGAGSASERRM